MTVKSITIGEPFFNIEYLSAEENFCLEEKGDFIEPWQEKY